MKDVLDVHTHTLASGHAYNTIQEMAQAASQKGIELLGITEHAPLMPGTCHLFYFENLSVVPREMFGVPLLLGSEVNICSLDGALDLEDRVLKKLDIAIASVHPPCLTAGAMEQNTHAIIEVMKNPYINIIGHPDDGRFALDYAAIVQAAKEYNCLLELNNSSLSPNTFRLNGHENIAKMLQYCKQYDVKVIMGSDAHVVNDIGNHGYVKNIVKEVNFPEILIINDDPKALLEMIRRKREV